MKIASYALRIKQHSSKRAPYVFSRRVRLFLCSPGLNCGLLYWPLTHILWCKTGRYRYTHALAALALRHAQSSGTADGFSGAHAPSNFQVVLEEVKSQGNTMHSMLSAEADRIERQVQTNHKKTTQAAAHVLGVKAPVPSLQRGHQLQIQRTAHLMDVDTDLAKSQVTAGGSVQQNVQASDASTATAEEFAAAEASVCHLPAQRSSST